MIGGGGGRVLKERMRMWNFDERRIRREGKRKKKMRRMENWWMGHKA